MRRPGTTFAITIAAAVVLALTGCTAHDDQAPDRTPSTPSGHAASQTPTVTAADRFGILTRPFAPSDALPDDATVPEDLVENSQRRAGESNGTTYWVATAAHHTVCLLAHTPDEDSVDDYSVCGQLPGDDDAVVTSMSDDAGHQTSLVADGFTDTGSDALHQIATNVWAR